MLPCPAVDVTDRLTSSNSNRSATSWIHAPVSRIKPYMDARCSHNSESRDSVRLCEAFGGLSRYTLTGPTIARTESVHHTGWIEDREHIREGLRVRPLHAQLGHERR